MRGVILKLLAVVFIAAIALAGWQAVRYQSFVSEPLAIGEQGLDLVIKPGSSLATVARDLQRKGVIEEPKLLIWMARFQGQSHNIKAGEYHIPGGIRPPEMLRLLVSGKVKQYALTLLEGWNFRQVMQAVNEAPHLEHTLTGLSDAEIMARIGYPDQHPEGRFFPDTYHFPQGMSDVEFLRRAHRSMADRLAWEWDNRAAGLPLRTPDEALVLASIVEKETGRASERPAIAGVFVRRLEKGMLLQTDPTVIYGIGADFDGNLTRKHLRQPTPYNTYTNKGLPPTPIAMPGGEAIHAALHPEEGDALYFVSRGDGTHYFSATLEEHNRAVNKYQLRRSSGSGN